MEAPNQNILKTQSENLKHWFDRLPHGVRTYLIIFSLLMIGLLLTVAAAHVHLGAFNLALALMIASTKAILVVVYFMHVKEASRLTWVFASAAFLWLGIMLVLTFGDYATRGPMPSLDRGAVTSMSHENAPAAP